MFDLNKIKKDKSVLAFINKTEEVLKSMAFTDHGLRHSNLVADRARNIANQVGLSDRETELAAIAAYCHDMANFLSRTYHNYFGAMLFHQVFKDDFEPDEITKIMQAISNHDKRIEDVVFSNPISAIVVLADKSDVHRSRVIERSMEKIKLDIHDRVNYATTDSKLKINKKNKLIILNLEIDANSVSIMEYFEIFTSRMVFCRKAAKSLGYNFSLVINKFKLL